MDKGGLSLGLGEAAGETEKDVPHLADVCARIAISDTVVLPGGTVKLSLKILQKPLALSFPTRSMPCKV